MNKEFIPYEQALELKELGFNEECFGFYTLEGCYFLNTTELNSLSYACASPLYQQSFRWFREKGYRFGIRWDVEYDKYWFDVWSSYKKDDETFYQFQFESEIIYNTYEEMEQACLTKLIEIVKNK
jgi:hypothetical protein